MATPKKKGKTRPELTSDYHELLRCFHAQGVKYLLIGGYAVGVHGYSRPTRDIDLWIAIAPENAKRISQALIDFAFAPEEVPPDLFVQPQSVFRFGRDPWRVELLTSPSGVDFDECWGRRTTWQIDDLSVPVIGLSDLRQNKRASGRDRDLADLNELPPSQGIRCRWREELVLMTHIDLQTRQVARALLLCGWILYGLIIWWVAAHNLSVDNPFALPLLGVAALWTAAGVALLWRPRWAWHISLLLAGAPLLLCVAQTIRRVAFIAEHGGMDAAQPPGSPMAFLIGWIAEWIFLGGPGVVLTALLLVSSPWHLDAKSPTPPAAGG